MTLDEIIAEKLSRLNSVPDKLLAAVERIQPDQYTRLLELLSSLEINGEIIIKSKENLQVIENIIQEMKDNLIDPDPEIITEYEKAVRSFITEFKTQATLTESYFAKAFSESPPISEFSKEVALKSRQQTANLLLGSSTEDAFFDPIREQLTNAVSSGASYKETVESLKNVVVGDPQKEGALQSHIKQIAHDSFAVADRSYTNVLAQEMGAEWYSYKGSEIKTTRPFCAERHQKYFHKKEVQAWAAKDWAGKATGTTESTIFQWAGGYNCRHSINPVSINRVPKDVIQRAIEQGFYKPEAEKKER